MTELDVSALVEEGDLYDSFRFQLTRRMDRALLEEANSRSTIGGKRASKGAVVRDAVRLYLAGRMGPRSPVGEQLRRAREDAGLTLTALEAMTRSRPKASVVWRIENTADRSPRLHTLESLARALDATIVIDPNGTTVLRRTK